MKINNMKWIALLAMAGFAISTQSAKAAGFANGDLIFGVEDTNSSDPGFNNVYMIDLGVPPPSGSRVATGLGTDLSNLFGSNWYTNTSLQWGIIGYASLGGKLSISEAEQTYGTQSTPYDQTVVGGSTAKSSISGLLNSTEAAARGGSNANNIAAEGGGAFVSTTTGVGQLSSTTETWGANLVGGANANSIGNSDWGYFQTLDQAVGFSGSALDMYTITGLNASQNTYVGTYTVDSSGDVSFSSSPPSSAPEAGSGLTLMALGLGCVVTLRRRLAKPA